MTDNQKELTELRQRVRDLEAIVSGKLSKADTGLGKFYFIDPDNISDQSVLDSFMAHNGWRVVQ